MITLEQLVKASNYENIFHNEIGSESGIVNNLPIFASTTCPSDIVPMVLNNKRQELYLSRKQLMLSQEEGAKSDQNKSSTLRNLLVNDVEVHVPPRARRKFVPLEKKDGTYWTKRYRNNDSARRSRIKRRCLDKILEHKLQILEAENRRLKYELKILKENSADMEHKTENNISPNWTSHMEKMYTDFQERSEAFWGYCPGDARQCQLPTSCSEDNDTGSSSSFSISEGSGQNSLLLPSDVSGSNSDEEITKTTIDLKIVTDLETVSDLDTTIGLGTIDKRPFVSLPKMHMFPHKLRVKKKLSALVDSA